MTLKQERQKEFDTVYNYYKNGGKHGVAEGGGCTYLTKEGGMCAIGVLIQNCGLSVVGRRELGMYIGSMGHRALTETLKLRDDKDFYIDLQRCHDLNLTLMSEGEDLLPYLEEFADEYKLEVPE